ARQETQNSGEPPLPLTSPNTHTRWRRPAIVPYLARFPFRKSSDLNGTIRAPRHARTNSATSAAHDFQAIPEIGPVGSETVSGDRIDGFSVTSRRDRFFS